MDGTKYFSQNKYLSSIFQKQAGTVPPIKAHETDTPFHFHKKQMSEQQQRLLLQKRIFDNPSLYVSTHTKCQICNKYIQIQLVNHHSNIHFQEEQRISRILKLDNK